MKYRSKVVEIEAIQWDGKNGAEIQEFTEGGFNWGHDDDGLWAEVYDYLQQTWVGTNLRDFIIKGTEDEFYPCEAGVFKKKYEQLDESPDNQLGLYEAEVKK